MVNRSAIDRFELKGLQRPVREWSDYVLIVSILHLSNWKEIVLNEIKQSRHPMDT